MAEWNDRVVPVEQVRADDLILWAKRTVPVLDTKPALGGRRHPKVVNGRYLICNVAPPGAPEDVRQLHYRLDEWVHVVGRVVPFLFARPQEASDG